MLEITSTTGLYITRNIYAGLVDFSQTFFLPSSVLTRRGGEKVSSLTETANYEKRSHFQTVLSIADRQRKKQQVMSTSSSFTSSETCSLLEREGRPPGELSLLKIKERFPPSGTISFAKCTIAGEFAVTLRKTIQLGPPSQLVPQGSLSLHRKHRPRWSPEGSIFIRWNGRLVWGRPLNSTRHPPCRNGLS